MDISPAFGRGKSDDLPFLSLLALLCIFKKKKNKASFFIQAFGCTTSQQLTLITANWICTEQSGLHASPQSYALIYRRERGEIKSHLTHISLRGNKHKLILFLSVLFFGFQCLNEFQH